MIDRARGSCSLKSTLKRLLPGLGLIGLALVGLAAGTAEAQSEQLARAQELVDSGDVQAALEILDRLSEQTPPNAEVLLLRSTVHFISGDLEAGRRDLDRSLKVDPDLRQAWLNRAALDLSDQRYPEALQALERARDLDPDAPDNDLNIGAVQLLQGNLQEASRLFSSYLTANSTSADAFYLVATNYAMAGYAGPSIEHLRLAIQLDEKSRLRARTDPNFQDLASNSRFQQLLSTDTYRMPQGSYQRSITVETTFAGTDSVLLRAVLDALQFSKQPFDRRVEVTDDWALIWGEMRIKLANTAAGKGQIQLSAPASQFTPDQWQTRTDDLIREITVRLTTRQR